MATGIGRENKRSDVLISVLRSLNGPHSYGDAKLKIVNWLRSGRKYGLPHLTFDSGCIGNNDTKLDMQCDEVAYLVKQTLEETVKVRESHPSAHNCG